MNGQSEIGSVIQKKPKSTTGNLNILDATETDILKYLAEAVSEWEDEQLIAASQSTLLEGKMMDIIISEMCFRELEL